MEKKEFYVQPKIADKIVELCQEHNLPVNIIIGVLVDGMKQGYTVLHSAAC